jgi:hypothetical protein
MSQKIVSFSLWGTNPLYIGGAYERIKEVKYKFGADWKVHISFGHDVTPADYMNLSDLVDQYSHHKTEDAIGLFWRGLPDADVLLIRDIDAVISDREVDAIKKWMETDYPFCVFHDHWGHIFPIPGGLLSVKGERVGAINWFYRSSLNTHKNVLYGQDEVILAHELYPMINFECLDFTSQGKHFDFAAYEELPPRLDPTDVIGDGMNRYPL